MADLSAWHLSAWKRHDPQYNERLAARLAARINRADKYRPNRTGAKITAEVVRCIRKRHLAAYSNLGPTAAARALAKEYTELRYHAIYELIMHRTWRNI